MTRRTSRALGLAPASVIFVVMACGSSHGSGDAPGDGGSASGGPFTGSSGAGTDSGPYSGTGGGIIDPGTTGGVGVGNAPATGGVGSGGGPAGGFAGGGFGATGGAATGGAASGGTGGVQYPPGSCPALPPPNGSSCASYVVDPGFRCFYDAPACRVVSSCTAGSKWRSGCDATTGEGGAPSGEAGAGGAAN